MANWILFFIILCIDIYEEEEEEEEREREEI
jgi:hypothetical protein